jgi:hypothetical protein
MVASRTAIQIEERIFDVALLPQCVPLASEESVVHFVEQSVRGSGDIFRRARSPFLPFDCVLKPTQTGRRWRIADDQNVSQIGFRTEFALARQLGGGVLDRRDWRDRGESATAGALFLASAMDPVLALVR